MYITLTEAKKHLRIDDFFKEDDEMIKEIIAQAERVTELENNQPLERSIDPKTGELSPSVKRQILLLIGSFYNNAEGTTSQNLKETPLGYMYMADKNRRYTIL